MQCCADETKVSGTKAEYLICNAVIILSTGSSRNPEENAWQWHAFCCSSQVFASNYMPSNFFCLPPAMWFSCWVPAKPHFTHHGWVDAYWLSNVITKGQQLICDLYQPLLVTRRNCNNISRTYLLFLELCRPLAQVMRLISLHRWKVLLIAPFSTVNVLEKMNKWDQRDWEHLKI